MIKIETLEELGSYIDFSIDDLPKLFNGDKSQWDAVINMVEKIMSDNKEVDLPLLKEENWKLVLNVRPEVPETRPEMHEDWHDLSLYLTGANDLTVGKEMKGAFEKEPGGGEWRGGEIVDSEVVKLEPEDRLLVSAGDPHQNSLQPKTSFFVMKVRKGKEKETPVADVIESLQGGNTKKI